MVYLAKVPVYIYNFFKQQISFLVLVVVFIYFYFFYYLTHRSITTLRGGGGIRFPEIVITLMR